MKIQKEKTVVRSYTAPKLSSFGKVAELTQGDGRWGQVGGRWGQTDSNDPTSSVS